MTKYRFKTREEFIKEYPEKFIGYNNSENFEVRIGASFTSRMSTLAGKDIPDEYTQLFDKVFREEIDSARYKDGPYVWNISKEFFVLKEQVAENNKKEFYKDLPI